MICWLTVIVGAQLVWVVRGQETLRQPATSISQFSYQVLISQLDESPKCGGVLVAEGFIITSATCVLEFGGIMKFMEEAVLYGGGINLLTDLGDVVDAVVHPQYTKNPSAYDVVLVKYDPHEKGPKLNSTDLSGNWTDDMDVPCILTSWWDGGESWPERLRWQPVSLTPCSPAEGNLICFTDEATVLHQNDYGSPIVCGGVLTGLIPRGGGKRAINMTTDYAWITDTMADLRTSVPTPEPEEDDTHKYLHKILEALDSLSHRDSTTTDNHLSHWNNQIVIPLNYVLFAMVIFFFILLFFIILFTVVLVYYSKK